MATSLFAVIRDHKRRGELHQPSTIAVCRRLESNRRVTPVQDIIFLWLRSPCTLACRVRVHRFRWILVVGCWFARVTQRRIAAPCIAVFRKARGLFDERAKPRPEGLLTQDWVLPYMMNVGP